MTTQSILKLLDPKNQNLPEIKTATTEGKCSLVIEPEFKKLKCGEMEEKIAGGTRTIKIGVGPEKNFDARAIRRFFGGAYTGFKDAKPKQMAFKVKPEWVKFATVGVHVAALNPGLLKPSFKPENQPEIIFVNKAFKGENKEIKSGKILAEGKNLVRLLGAIPPNVLNPQSYGDLIMALAKKWKMKATRVPKAKLKKYELLNAVSLGSVHDSELLILEHKGKVKKAKALLGKGICFDSGGIIGKQDHMKSMKEDMCGSAAVLGTALQVAKGNVKPEETIYFVFALAENMMGPAANRADDIWTAGDGQTVEIAHTDAEGRLVLGDAICYVKENFKNAEEYYTIATLTGSCVRALGATYTGNICSDDKVAQKAQKAGQACGDYIFTGPWNMEYDALLNTPIADVANLASTPEAGWITAAMYMNRFMPKDKEGNNTAVFCHFDIAGSIDMYEKGNKWRAKGLNSGVGVSLLTEIIGN